MTRTWSSVSLPAPSSSVMAGPHHVRVGIFVVDAQQAVLAVAGTDRQRHVADEIAVVAELLRLAVGGERGRVEGHVARRSGRPSGSGCSRCSPARRDASGRRCVSAPRSSASCPPPWRTSATWPASPARPPCWQAPSAPRGGSAAHQQYRRKTLIFRQSQSCRPPVIRASRPSGACEGRVTMTRSAM